MPFCPTIKLHADGHTGPCGKRTQVGGACLEPGCVKHCSKACRVLDNHPPDLVKLAEIAANTKESRGSGATIRLKEAEAKALAAGLTPEQAKKAGIEAGGKQLQSFKKRVSETQGLGASDRYTEAYDAAIESGATEDDANDAGAEAAGEQYMLAKEREFQTRGAGAGSLRSKVEADSLSTGLSESESRERGLVASGPQYQKKTARKLNTTGSGASLRSVEAISAALAAGSSPAAALQAGRTAAGSQYLQARAYASDTRGQGASDRYTEAYDAAIESGATEDDARAAGAETAGRGYALALAREANRIATRRQSRVSLIESAMKALGGVIPPRFNMIGITERMFRLAGGTIVNGMALPPGTLITVSVVPANLHPTTGVQAQLFEMLQGLIGRPYSHYHIRRDPLTGRPIMSILALLELAIQRLAIFWETTPDTLAHLAYEQEAESQRILFPLPRSSRGYSKIGVGSGGPPIRGVTVGGLRTHLLSGIIVPVPEDVRRDLVRRMSQMSMNAARLRHEIRQSPTVSSEVLSEDSADADAIEDQMVARNYAKDDDCDQFSAEAEGGLVLEADVDEERVMSTIRPSTNPKRNREDNDPSEEEESRKKRK